MEEERFLHKSIMLDEVISILNPSENELKLKLEQLRWMDNNYKIKIIETNFESISIDTKDDLNNLLEYYKKEGN